jgi:hypothetical protein
VGKFIEFKNLVENQPGKRIKMLRTDNGTEYINSKLSDICKQAGIVHQTSCAYTPAQNGRSERINHTICEKARSMLMAAKCNQSLWAEACNTAIYLINRSPHSSIGGKIPEEVWTGSPIDVCHLKIFGCKVSVHVPRQKRGKWDAKATEGIFIGYSDNIKDYRIMDPKTGEVQVARDVKLFEYERCEISVFNMEEDDQEIFYHESFKNDGLDSGVEI